MPLRRSARFSEGASSSAAPPPSPPPSPPRKSSSLKPISERGIIPGRPVNLQKYSYGFFVQRVIDMGWEETLTNDLREKYYPTLVREFYMNLHYDEEEENIITRVKGTTIIFNVINLSFVCTLPSDGLSISDKTINDIEPQLIWGDLFPDNVTCYQKDLFQEGHMAHRVICDNFITKKGNFDRITEDAMVLLYCFMRNIRVNMAELIFHRMCLGPTMPSLPYGVYITHILRFHGVDLEGETTSPKQGEYDDTSIKLMKPRAPPSAEPSSSRMDRFEARQKKMEKKINKIYKRQGKAMTLLKKIWEKIACRAPDSP